MRKLVVISVDSLFTSDLDKIKDLTGFSEALSDSIIVKNIECIYPTLTYPCHATIMTGCYPNKHGIFHNEKLDPGIHNGNWFWHYKDLKVKTIFDYARENKLTTAAVSWPVTGDGPIDYLLPEIWPLDYERSNSAILNAASLEGKKVYYRNKHLLNWKENLALDTFAEAAVMDIVDHYQPDVLFLHQATLDHERHINGTQGDAILEAHQKHGHWLANIFEMYRRAGIFDKTTFVVLGDHGQLNIRRVVSINEMLRREGLIKTDGLGNVIDYDAYVQSAGISGHVYIKNKLAATKVIGILEEAKRLGYIEHIFNTDQLNSMHLSGDFDYVVESCPFISISNDVDGEIVNEINNDDYKYAKATHGHLPTKGDRPPFIIYNSQLPARVIEYGRLVDEFPTFMKLLGFVIPDNIDGTALI